MKLEKWTNPSIISFDKNILKSLLINLRKSKRIPLEDILYSRTVSSFVIFLKFLEKEEKCIPLLQRFLSKIDEYRIYETIPEGEPIVLEKNSEEGFAKSKINIRDFFSEYSLELDFTKGKALGGYFFPLVTYFIELVAKILWERIKRSSIAIPTSIFIDLKDIKKQEEQTVVEIAPSNPEKFPVYIDMMIKKIVDGNSPRYFDWFFLVRYVKSIGYSYQKTIALLRKSPLYDEKIAVPQVKWIYEKNYGPPTKKELLYNGYLTED